MPDQNKNYLIEGNKRLQPTSTEPRPAQSDI